MDLIATVVGIDEMVCFATVEPDDNIATLLEQIKRELVSQEMPPEFTAFSVEHTRPGGLVDDDDPDYVGLCEGDPHVMARYLTPGARLDPDKRVGDYFRRPVAPETVSIALVCPPEAIEEEKARREHGWVIAAEHLARMKQERQPPLRDDICADDLPLATAKTHAHDHGKPAPSKSHGRIQGKLTPAKSKTRVATPKAHECAHDKSRVSLAKVAPSLSLWQWAASWLAVPGRNVRTLDDGKKDN